MTENTPPDTTPENPPTVFRRIHPTKNPTIDFSQGMPPVKSKIWWQCEKNHSWVTSINNQNRRKSCPICSNKLILQGYNDLATTSPQMAAQWHPTKNTLKPTEITDSSGKKIWWQCSKKHEWLSAPNSRNQKAACPVCSGRHLQAGVNDLATFQPNLATLWHKTRNGDLKPSSYRAGSSNVVWWQGECGHEWKRAIQNMVTNPTCPQCYGNKVNPGKSDLATTNPELAAEWHPTKNGEQTPADYQAGNGYKAWWQCAEKHEWQASIYSRKTRNCPVCAGQKIVAGFNDLATTHPKIASEWHPTKNGDLTPKDISKGGTTVIWWKCEKEHEWKIKAFPRTKRGNGCGKCSHPISKAEKEIFEYITQLGLTAEQNNRKVLNGKELDIYIPSKMIAIEFNGVYWHSETMGKDRNYHHSKWLAAKEAGIQLIQIWEDDWEADKAKVLKGLEHKLGMSKQEKVSGRKTKPVLISYPESLKFLNLNHIQGNAAGSYYLALKQGEETVAVLVLKREGVNDLNIIRYATSKQVIGGFTKLLSYATKTYAPSSYITFSDHTISDGGLYENNGFTADKELPPDYMYVVNGKRQHKFGYRLKKFRNDPKLLWEEGLTEKQLALLNNIPRIWDAGKTRWVKMV